MQALRLRAGRRPLAQTIVVLSAVAVLGACADESTAPSPRTPARAAFAGAPNQGPYTTSVDLAVYSTVTVYPVYGAKVQLAVTCTSNEVFDVVVDLEQDQRFDTGKARVQGTVTAHGIACGEASAGFWVDIHPFFGEFQPGRATVRARIAGQQPWVEPAEVDRRVRVYAGEIM